MQGSALSARFRSVCRLWVPFCLQGLGSVLSAEGSPLLLQVPALHASVRSANSSSTDSRSFRRFPLCLQVLALRSPLCLLDSHSFYRFQLCRFPALSAGFLLCQSALVSGVQPLWSQSAPCHQSVPSQTSPTSATASHDQQPSTCVDCLW